MQKYPYIIVVGEQEEKDNTITVRQHGGEDLGTISVNDFSEMINKKIKESLKSF